MIDELAGALNPSYSIRGYYDLYDTILQPRLSKQNVTDQQEIRQTMTKYNLNEPQAKAVLSSIKTNGFSLIQGYVALLIHCRYQYSTLITTS